MKLTDFTPGLRVHSAKWCAYGTVDHTARVNVHVLMDDRKMRPLPPTDLRPTSPARMPKMRNPALEMPRMRSTVIRPVPVPPKGPSARERRLLARNGATTRDMLTPVQRAALAS